MFKGKLFSTGVENIIEGPFEEHDKNTCIKKLNDGQIIKLPSPASAACNAIIKKKKIFIDLEKQQGNDNLNQLSGQIASMMFEEKTSLVITTVTVHDIFFVVGLSPDKITELELYPGKKVVLKFNLNNITWI